jgi:hypothetical protein
VPWGRSAEAVSCGASLCDSVHLPVQSTDADASAAIGFTPWPSSSTGICSGGPELAINPALPGDDLPEAFGGLRDRHGKLVVDAVAEAELRARGGLRGLLGGGSQGEAEGGGNGKRHAGSHGAILFRVGTVAIVVAPPCRQQGALSSRLPYECE